MVMHLILLMYMTSCYTGEPISSVNFNVFNGTSTVTMREGPVTDVPTTITLLGDSAISIVFDPSRTNNHFGNSAIYGLSELGLCRVSAVLQVGVEKKSKKSAHALFFYSFFTRLQMWHEYDRFYPSVRILKQLFYFFSGRCPIIGSTF